MATATGANMIPLGSGGGAGMTPGSTPGVSTPGSEFGTPVPVVRKNVRLPPEVNRILYVRNLPYKITNEELYDIFGKFGSIRQIRKGVEQNTKGTAFVVFDDIYEAKVAMDGLSGFNVAGRYLVILYYNQRNIKRREDLKDKKEELERIQKMYGMNKKKEGEEEA